MMSSMPIAMPPREGQAVFVGAASQGGRAKYVVRLTDGVVETTYGLNSEAAHNLVLAFMVAFASEGDLLANAFLRLLPEAQQE